MKVDASNILVDCTPITPVEVDGIDVFVKREDLCSPYPGPQFSKMRGVVAHIKRRPEATIGVLDTYHSKAGWAVAYACAALGKKAVNFWPIYKHDPSMREQQEIARSFGAKLVSMPAGRSSVLYHAAKKSLPTVDRDCYMMPNALKIEESVTENAAEARRSLTQLPEGATIVLSISSGTVAAGVMKALSGQGFRFVLHMGYSRSQSKCADYIDAMVGELFWNPQYVFVDEGFGYADSVDCDAPFPCNPYYDLKAWRWLTTPKNLQRLAANGPIVFWNIGA